MTTVLRSIVKYVFALAFYYSGISGLLLYIKKHRCRPWPLVLMYHRIVEPKDAAGLQPGMFVYKDIFEKQIEYISKCFRILSISDFARGLAENRRYRGDEMIITIDDGWRDNFTNGLPILQKYNSAPRYLYGEFYSHRLPVMVSRNQLDTIATRYKYRNARGGYQGYPAEVSGFNQCPGTIK
jgi:hypothetical protein